MEGNFHGSGDAKIKNLDDQIFRYSTTKKDYDCYPDIVLFSAILSATYISWFSAQHR